VAAAGLAGGRAAAVQIEAGVALELCGTVRVVIIWSQAAGVMPVRAGCAQACAQAPGQAGLAAAGGAGGSGR